MPPPVRWSRRADRSSAAPRRRRRSPRRRAGGRWPDRGPGFRPSRSPYAGRASLPAAAISSAGTKRIADRIPRGTDPQRTLDDLDLHVAGRADQARRKPLQTIAHFESHAGLRGGEGMSDAGLRVERMESVQDPLVGDLSGEADVARRDGASVRAHQRTTPMRGGSRNMRRPLRPEPHEIIADRLARARKHEGARGQDRPEKDLEPSIPANVAGTSPHPV